ncbi:MAG: hypothetical protein GXO48_02890 [Chlorobi bacterium]|nr:hypothetical protein [Chlorobiota bacterium]
MNKTIIKLAENKWVQILTVSVLVGLTSLSHVYEDTIIFNHVGLEVGIISAVLLMTIAIYIIIFVWKRHKAIISLRDVIVSLISGGMGFSGIISMLAFLIGVGWLTDDLREGKYCLALSSLGLIGSISGLYALSITVKRKTKKKIYPTKVLFSALSIPPNQENPNPKEVIDKIKQLYDETRYVSGQFPQVPSSTIRNTPMGNILYPLLWRIKYSNMKKMHIYFIISKQVCERELTTVFKEILILISQQIGNNQTRIEVNFSDPVDFNDYHAISQELECMLNKALRKHDEEDIAFNISPGTSAVTSAMILAALKEARQIEYITQTTDSKDPVELRAFDITEEEILRFGILNK